MAVHVNCLSQFRKMVLPIRISPYASEDDATHLNWAQFESIGCELVVADFDACGNELMLPGGWMQLRSTVHLEVVVPVT